MIEETIKRLKEDIDSVLFIVKELKKELIPEKQDTTELSERTEERLNEGEEPRNYK